MLHRRLAAFAAIAALPLASASAAQAATLTVDDDRAECPAATYTSIQAAVDAAAPGDTVTICPGAYVEGSGAPNTNALTISKSLTLKGAGADLVTITPRATTLAGSSIAGTTTDVRTGVGSIVAVLGTPGSPLDVMISGVTVSGEDAATGRPVASVAGILYLDAKGAIDRSRVTNVVTSEGAQAYTRVGGWRGALPGYGIVQTSATLVGVPGERRLTITSTRVDRYNRVGILIDGATNDEAPFQPSGVTHKGVVQASQVVGRVECANFEADGGCSRVGLLMSGPLFGQDGIRVTNGSRLEVSDSLISQNLVNGVGAPVRPTWSGSAYDAPTTDNANLKLAAGIRLAGASLTNWTTGTGPIIYSSATRSNVVDNGYGVLNVAADGVTDQVGNPSSDRRGNLFIAENNWWGLGYYKSANTGPAISPATNPAFPENPVNGASTTDPVGGANSTSNAVDFYPYRTGSQAQGQWPVLDVPMAIEDAAPTVSLSGPASAAPGATVTLTAVASDDIGVRSVVFSDGAAAVATAVTTPYTVTIPVPADAACGSVRSYGALVTDSSEQTAASAPVSVTVTCPPPRRDDGRTPQPPGPPSVTLGKVPATLSKATRVTFAVSAPAGFKSAKLTLGDRTVCTVTKAPYSCTVTPTGADVGRQVLRVVVTDAAGSTAAATATVTVPKFAAKLTTKVTSKKARGGQVKRTVRVTVVRPKGVTAKQACSNGHVTLTVKRGDRTVVNQQVVLKGSCTFTRSVTAPRRGSAFRLSAKFGGNAVVRSASTSRRFS